MRITTRFYHTRVEPSQFPVSPAGMCGTAELHSKIKENKIGTRERKVFCHDFALNFVNTNEASGRRSFLVELQKLQTTCILKRLGTLHPGS